MKPPYNCFECLPGGTVPKRSCQKGNKSSYIGWLKPSTRLCKAPRFPIFLRKVGGAKLCCKNAVDSGTSNSRKKRRWVPFTLFNNVVDA